ncbi:hypothetical protein [Ornithinimicrobium cryptoxanthini]|uniref:DUF3558 domain-containing protein n=1 Tax=Ornithinimicrobium cryptoxanthini TaxID=2934161 RepID=A0ABY4YF80_9MICO|nr:hypothetical protein [Ornithinimicrobium cryptoxanthini]USQ75186.1 hypothetical protein NF557_11140 [Ornithinimicrobium cryptoxanthini]
MVVNRLRASRRQVWATLAAALLLALLGGCGDGDSTTRQPTAEHSQLTAERSEFTVERTTRGGLCAEGPCRSELVVEHDGVWHYRANDGESKGRLTEGELSQVREALMSTRLGQATAPSTHCAEDSDGTSIGYAWTVDGHRQDVDSCEVQIKTDDPLVRALDELAERLKS